MKKIILIPKDDLVYYPPTLSLINVFLKLNREVICVGEYSDKDRKAKFEQNGVKFIPIYREIKDVSKYRIINWIVIIWRMHHYKCKIGKYLQSSEVSNDSLVWFIYSSSIGYLQKVIEKFDYIVQFYEFEDYSLGGKEKLLHPRYDVRRFLSKAKALIHCEYNRAMITNGLYGINKVPIILPNKPFGDEHETTVIPADIEKTVNDIKNKINGRKVILYQGIFNSSERRLDEFCEAVSLMPEEYVFIAMGSGGSYYDDIKNRYCSNRIIFLPFIRPPYHLQITQIAKFGILTYHPVNQTFVGVLNPLYCAPNKIFEYGKFGIPMIANDVPGLKLIFETFKCGKTISGPQTAVEIAKTILEIEEHYEIMSKGALAYYDSVNIESIVGEVLKDNPETV